MQCNGALFSPDGRLLYAEVRSNEFNPVAVQDLKVWDVATGELKAVFPHVTEAVLDAGHFTLSADGGRLAFQDNSDRRPMRVEVSKWSGEMFGHGSLPPIDVALNVSPGLPRVKIWDVARWEQIAVIDGASPLAFSPGGKTLVSGDRDWKVPVAKVWDAATGRLIRVLNDRSPGVWPITVSPGGRFLTSGSFEDKSLWDLADGRRWPLDPGRRGTSGQRPVFSPDGTRLYSQGLPYLDPLFARQPAECDCFDLTMMPPTRIKLAAGELIISPDGRRYAAARGERWVGRPSTLTFYNLPSLRETGHIDVEHLLGGEFSPDGRWLALLVGRNDVVPSASRTRFRQEIQLLEADSAHVVAVIPTLGPTWGNYGWKFSPDGNSLAFYYHTGKNVMMQGDPNPFDQPMSVEIWELFPQ